MVRDAPPIQPPGPDAAEAPPLFRSWNVWYALVLLVLALLIVAFTLFGRAFS